MTKYPIFPRGWKSSMTVRPQPEPNRKWWNVDHPAEVMVYRGIPDEKTGKRKPIRSLRRQARTVATKRLPLLASGRQWTKYRKNLKREHGVDYLSLQSYVVKEGE